MGIYRFGRCGSPYAAIKICPPIFEHSSKDSKYVISIGDRFNTPEDYLRLFGVEPDSTTSLWDVVIPRHPALKLWGPTYHHKYWHNDGDSARMLPTINEYYQNPDKPEISHQRNIDQYWFYLRANEVRLAFVKNLVDTGYVFTGAYRMSEELSDTTHIIWVRVADEIDLNRLNYLENLRN